MAHDNLSYCDKYVCNNRDKQNMKLFISHITWFVNVNIQGCSKCIATQCLYDTLSHHSPDQAPDKTMQSQGTKFSKSQSCYVLICVITTPLPPG